jgi:peptide/nickel transport system substrate-binding protein
VGKIARTLSLTVTAALLLAGCGSKPAATTPPTSSGSSSPAPAAPADPSKPQQGGTLIRAVNYGDPGTLDPIAKGDVANRMVVMQIFDNLVKYDPVAKQIKKSVAEDYQISPDGKAYTFKLRKGILFHNGRELKAQDVKYSMERATDTKNAGVTITMLDNVVGAVDFREGKAKEITGIAVKGDYELEIKLVDVKPSFLMDLASPGLGIVPKEEAEKSDFGQHPVGSGPFKFKAWQKDDKLELAANDKYYAGRPYLDSVVFRFMKEEQTRDAEFSSGTIDSQVIGEALYKKYAGDPEKQKQLVEVPELFTRAIHFNTSKPPFDNVKVRQAINYAVDKKAIIEKVLSNKAFVAKGVLPSSAAAFNPNIKAYDFNVEKAKQLLKEAGFEKGFEFEVYTSASTTKWMEAINTYLNPLGINGKINQTELSTVLQKGRDGDFQAVFYSTGGDADSLSFLMSRFHSKNFGKAGNNTLYKNAKVDQLLDEAARTVDAAKQKQLLQDAEQIIVDETPWFIFNYNKAVMIAQPWVHGLQPVPTDVDFQDLTQVWVTKKK